VRLAGKSQHIGAAVPRSYSLRVDNPLSKLVTPQTLGRIAREIPNIVGVKDGRPDQMWCWEAEREANYEIWVSNPLEDHWPDEMLRNPR
jgi:dihydrodipicolinate synthase/N-acetylneuraminate lyase